MNVITLQRLRRTLAALILSGGAFVLATNAFAGEGLFSRVYTTETTPAGHWELEQTVRNRTDRAYGRYVAEDFRTEAEYGFTDDFQGAFYLLTGRLDAKNAPDDNDPAGDVPASQGGITHNYWYFQGISGELIYRVLSPVKDPIGLAFYYEPTFEVHDQHDGLSYRNFENEYRVMLQKNFLDDRLIVAYNLVGEIEMYRYYDEPNDTGPAWTSEFDWNNELGATYRFASNWFGGWELRNHNELNDFSSRDHSILWTGPALHYAAKRAWVTLGVLREVYGSPTGIDDGGSQQSVGHLFLHSHEKWETTLKVGFPF